MKRSHKQHHYGEVMKRSHKQHHYSEVMKRSRKQHHYSEVMKRSRLQHRYREVHHAPKCKASSASSTSANQPVQSSDLGDEALVPAPLRTYQSMIGCHLVENEPCRAVYNDHAFHVLCCGRTEHHLEILEAVFIHTHSPESCTQKQH